MNISQEVISMLSPFRFSSGKVARNRIVVPPMASATADSQGHATAATLAHYARLAGVGAGIVFVEYSFVDPSGRSEPNQLGAADPVHFIHLSEIAQAIRSRGALTILQLVHAGGKSDPVLTEGHLMAPSAIAVPVKDRALEVPRAMTQPDIVRWKDAFRTAAVRAIAAGFDGVELHAAHGYGLNQWLSPITNRREDQYGGDIAGRSRLLLEITRDVRLAVGPDALVSVRLPGGDFLDGGMTTEEACDVTVWLERTGVDLVDVSSGLGGWRRPRDRDLEGYLLPEAERIQARTRLPVIAVGGFESAPAINAALAKGAAQFVAVGRATLEGRFKVSHQDFCSLSRTSRSVTPSRNCRN